MAAAAPAIFFGDLLVLAHGEARLAVAPMRRRCRMPLHRRLLGYSVMFIVLGASALFHAVANNPDLDASLVVVAAAGFLLWVAGAALLLLALTAERFPDASRLAARLVEALVAAFF